MKNHANTLTKEQGIKKGVLLSIILISIVLPFVLRTDLLFLCLSIIIFAIFAMSWDLMYGYTGLLSCGHAIFFGTGAYGFLYAWNLVGVNIWISMFLTLVLVLVLALLIGFVSNLIREGGFIIITLILTLIFYSLSMSWGWLTGAEDGLIFTGPDLAFPFLKLPLSTNLKVQYFFLLFFLLITYWLLRRLVNSPLGLIFQGIRENEVRMQFLGYNTHLYKTISFTISAAFAGLAGMLFLITQGYVSIYVFQPHLSFEAIIYTLFGGAGTLIGPLIGVILLYTIKYYLSDYFTLYQIVPAILLILVVLFRPKGFIDIVRFESLVNMFQNLKGGILNWKK